MTRAASGFSGPVALVPGELRGYRRFWLSEDGLHPTVHGRSRAWDAPLEHARCAAGQAHPAPARDCGCGLYGWYHPGDAGRDMGLGDVPAVIAARGRIVLGDHGFRAAAARVEAVALSWLVTPGPRSRERARRVLAERHPGARVYGTRRAMLRAHPPQDLSALGIAVRPSPTGRYRRMTYAVGVAGLLALCGLFLVARAAGAPPPVYGVLGILLLVAWQVTLVWLASHCSSLSGLRGEPGPESDPEPGSEVEPDRPG